MLEKMKKHKKASIREEDISTLFQRYTATTVLAVLQEVAQFPDVKIDWNALVKKTTTGISNAREYQMLWRHLAYRDALLDRLDDGTEPLDDDSDLEYELEAFPSVSNEASTEAAACVKVLIASGLPNGSTVEAPLTINIPNGQSSRAPSENSQRSTYMQGTNITVPVSVQKQPLPTVTSSERLDANGLANVNLPPRRKRKQWSTAEDMELIAAVQKCGEGNWANILKGDFKGDRTASQLSQRWTIIKKRQGDFNLGGASQLSEAQLAARRAVSLALDMPMGDKFKAACSIAGTHSNMTPIESVHPTAAEGTSIGLQSQHQSQQDSVPTAAHRSGTLGSLSKTRVTSKKPTTKSAVSPDQMVKAAAVAAGARIATPSDAASLLKAAQAKNAIHIMPGGGSLIKSSGNSNSLPTQLGAHPNVHFIRTGLAAAPLSTYSTVPTNSSRPGGIQQVQDHSIRPAMPTAQFIPQPNAVSEVTSPVASPILTAELEVKTAGNITISGTNNISREQIKEDQAGFSGKSPREKVTEDQATTSGNPSEKHVEEDQNSIFGNAPNKQVQEDQTALPSSKGIRRTEADFVANSKCSSSADRTGNDQSVIVGNQATAECTRMNDDNMIGLSSKEIGDNQYAVKNLRVNGKQEDLQSLVVDRSDEKLEFPSKAAIETETRGEEKGVAGLV